MLSFQEWIDGYTSEKEDAVSFVRKWMKRKKINEVSLDNYEAYLDEHKANKNVRLCFETARKTYAYVITPTVGGVVDFLFVDLCKMVDNKPVVLNVKKYLKGLDEEGERAEDEVIAVRNFQTQPAIVSVKMGLTKDLGGYESARCDVRLDFPCYAEEVKTAFDLAEKFVSVKLLNEFKIIEGKEDEKLEEPDLFLDSESNQEDEIKDLGI